MGSVEPFCLRRTILSPLRFVFCSGEKEGVRDSVEQGAFEVCSGRFGIGG